MGVRPVEGRDVGLGPYRLGADWARVGDVVEEHVHAVWLVLEAQVAHPGTVAVIGTDGRVQAGLLGRRGGTDAEARVEDPHGSLAGWAQQAGRERLVAEAPT